MALGHESDDDDGFLYADEMDPNAELHRQSMRS